MWDGEVLRFSNLMDLIWKLHEVIKIELLKEDG